MPKLTVKRSNRPLEEGDIIGFYGDNTHYFRLGIALDANRAVTIFDLKTGLAKIFNLINNVATEEIELSTLKLPDEVAIDSMPKDTYEIYNINIYTTPKIFERSVSEFFEILRINLNQLGQLVEGDIVKMQGMKLTEKLALYHHHAIYSDAKKCKVIHKWGELNKLEIVKNICGEKFECVGVREDNLLEVAVFREISVSNCYDQQYMDQIRDSEKIVMEARKRVGEIGYDIMTDNCQHFCTDCRYGIPVAIEIENTKMAVAATVVGVSVLVAGAGALFSAYKTSRKKEGPKQLKS